MDNNDKTPADGDARPSDSEPSDPQASNAQPTDAQSASSQPVEAAQAHDSSPAPDAPTQRIYEDVPTAASVPAADAGDRRRRNRRLLIGGGAAVALLAFGGGAFAIGAAVADDDDDDDRTSMHAPVDHDGARDGQPDRGDDGDARDDRDRGSDDRDDRGSDDGSDDGDDSDDRPSSDAAVSAPADAAALRAAAEKAMAEASGKGATSIELTRGGYDVDVLLADGSEIEYRVSTDGSVRVHDDDDDDTTTDPVIDLARLGDILAAAQSAATDAGAVEPAFHAISTSSSGAVYEVELRSSRGDVDVDLTADLGIDRVDLDD